MAGRVMIGLNRHHPLERMGGGGDVVAMVEEKAQSKDHTDAGRREHQCAATQDRRGIQAAGLGGHRAGPAEGVELIRQNR